MVRTFFALGALSAFVGVALGAFGAHGLKTRLEPDMLAIFEVGVRYEMYHAFALMAAAWAVSRTPSSAAAAAGWLFVVGTVVLAEGNLWPIWSTTSDARMRIPKWRKR